MRGSMTAVDPLRPYVPAMLDDWLADPSSTTGRAVDSTLVFVDISGFTSLSERLARRGNIGAEELSEAIGTCFVALLGVSHALGGALLKFGGDALLVMFTGPSHVQRACRAAIGMRQALRDVGILRTSAGQVRLRMSTGVHRGTTHAFLVGSSHLELVIAGPGPTQTVTMEAAAGAGEIVVSPATAAVLDPGCVGAARGPGYLLHAAPAPAEQPTRVAAAPVAAPADLGAAVPVALRTHLLDRPDPEHRRVTVTFVRLQGIDTYLEAEGSAALAVALDTCITAVQRAVDRHGVTFLGTDIDAGATKVLLAAGAPTSGGNDEERMLLALREIVTTDLPLPVRVGVHVGNVFAGDIGPPDRRAYTVMGDAVNLAARVMGRAEPGMVLATTQVLQGSRTRFETTELEPFRVKGKRHPVTAHTVGPASGTRAPRLDEGPMVGRERELAVFDEVLVAARAGSGQILEIVGEAGIGKSRLLAAFQERARGFRTVALSGELHRATTSYRVAADLLRTILAVPPGATPQEVTDRLLATLRDEVPELLEWAPLLGMVLGLELPATASTADLDERFVRPRLHQAVAQLLRWDWDGRVLVSLEDAQWIDEASLDVLGAALVGLEAEPWVVCVTRREPLAAPPDDLPRRVLTLEPLDGAATERMAQVVTDAAPLPPDQMRALVERSGGNPLFLRELVAAVQDTGSVATLPDAIGSLVTARIDRLPPPARTALREVAVLGHRFPWSLAEAVVSAGGTRELRRLDDFLADEGANARFRHALLRDSAYEGLPFARRRELHALAGDTVAATGEASADVLSFHYHLAGRHGDSWRTSRTAAGEAAAVYANEVAAMLLERALDSARELADLDPCEIAEAHERLGDLRHRMGRLQEAGDAYRRAGRLVRDDAVASARLALKRARIDSQVKRYSQALATLTRGLRRLEGLEHPEAVGQRAQLMVWYGHYRQEQGAHQAALRWTHRAIEAAEAADERDALAHAYRLLDWIHADRGAPDRTGYGERALALYEELDDLPNQATVRNNLGAVAYWRGDWASALEHYRRASELDERTGDVLGAAFGWNNTGEILADQGRWDEADALFRAAERVFRAAQFVGGVLYAKANLGRTAGRAGRYADARTLLEEAHELARSIGAATQMVEVEARLAELDVLSGRAETALATVERALRRADDREGVAAQLPLLQRVRGLAHLQRRELGAAREALDASLAAADARRADYERAVTYDAIARLDAYISGAPDPVVDVRDGIFARLGVERLPDVPMPTAPTG